MMAIYANENKDAIMLGTREGTATEGLYQESYWFRRSAGLQLMMWGMYYAQGYMPDPRIAYCPSSVDEFHQYDSESNLFRPGPPHPAAPAATRAGYSLRPMDQEGTPIVWPITANAGNWTIAEGIPMRTGVTANWGPITNNSPRWKPLPRRAKFKTTAVVTDVISSPIRLQWRHKAGFNALYGDGSAKWTDKDLLFNITGGTLVHDGQTKTIVSYASIPQPFDVQYNGTMIRIWQRLDEESR
jgi:prepilin-type processing-associated H-X9-DG protein